AADADAVREPPRVPEPHGRLRLAPADRVGEAVLAEHVRVARQVRVDARAGERGDELVAHVEPPARAEAVLAAQRGEPARRDLRVLLVLAVAAPFGVAGPLAQHLGANGGLERVLREAGVGLA